MSNKINEGYTYKKYVRQPDDSWKEEVHELPGNYATVYFCEFNKASMKLILDDSYLKQWDADTTIRSHAKKILDSRNGSIDFNEVCTPNSMLAFCNKQSNGWQKGNYQPKNPSGLTIALAKANSDGYNFTLKYEHESFFIYNMSDKDSQTAGVIVVETVHCIES